MDVAQFRFSDGDATAREDGSDGLAYEYILRDGLPYLCTLPQVQHPSRNTTEAVQPSEEEQTKEHVRATSRGWELLQEMNGKPCLFYTTGWWSYSFCYNNQIRQFHSLPAGMNGAPIWPPTEDPTTPTYVLGKYDQPKDAMPRSGNEAQDDDVVELQRRAETTYLIQRLDGGTPCDLTGQNRKIEVQFHCNPQSTDRIGWIKETATCSYLMVIYTPRLCNDVAFLPPKETGAQSITCYEVLGPNDVNDWEAKKLTRGSQQTIDEASNPRVMVGAVEVGGMKQIGRDGKNVERGRVVMTAEEKAEIVAVQKDGKIEGLSKSELKKMDLDPEEFEKFRKEMQDWAGKRDWKIERLDDVDGHIQLRGVVAGSSGKDEDDSDRKQQESTDESNDDTFHEEI